MWSVQLTEFLLSLIVPSACTIAASPVQCGHDGHFCLGDWKEIVSLWQSPVIVTTGTLGGGTSNSGYNQDLGNVCHNFHWDWSLQLGLAFTPLGIKPKRATWCDTGVVCSCSILFYWYLQTISVWKHWVALFVSSRSYLSMTSHLQPPQPT